MYDRTSKPQEGFTCKDSHMINSIHRKHKYHQISQRRALTSRKRLCERWVIKNILTCVTELKEHAKTKII